MAFKKGLDVGFSLVKIRRDLPFPAEAVEETHGALALERAVRSGNRPRACLHVMHVTAFVSTVRRMHRPGSCGGGSSPGGDPGLAGETRW